LIEGISLLKNKTDVFTLKINARVVRVLNHQQE